ncbi:MAG: ABC transporter ATP-binding protein [Alphaproteobacteria bacterium]|nr:ABC transporter ATP-binding protein [Alphaproteobacteria bacterium]
MNNNKKVLELNNVIKTYRQGKQNLEVLTGVDLEILKGDAIALVGQSGAGKSTLLQIAGLLDKPTSGKVILDGINVSKSSDDVRTDLRRDYIGFVYQYHNLLGDFSALENVMLPMIIARKSKNEAKERAVMLLEKMHLSHRLNHRPAELSGGEQQRVAIARALSNSPKLLLADEPTGNLDPNTAEDVFETMLSVVKETGLSLLIATHNMELASRLGSQYKLKGGVLANVNEPILSKITKNFY